MEPELRDNTNAALIVAKRRRVIEAVAMIGTWLLCIAAVLLGTFAVVMPHGPDLPLYQVVAGQVLRALTAPWFWLHALLAWILGWFTATLILYLSLPVLWTVVVSAVLNFVFALSDRRRKG
jgi:hypothetical protein